MIDLQHQTPRTHHLCARHPPMTGYSREDHVQHFLLCRHIKPFKALLRKTCPCDSPVADGPSHQRLTTALQTSRQCKVIAWLLWAASVCGCWYPYLEPTAKRHCNLHLRMPRSHNACGLSVSGILIRTS
jgi:hypothetical protein